VRAYLRVFLADPWVVDAPRLPWFLIRNLVVLPLRPRRLAPLYQAIWTDQGSPLDANTKRQATALQHLLQDRLEVAITVGVGMRYGRPSIQAGLRELRDAGCGRVLIMPLFPQYSGTTTGSTFAVVAKAFETWQDPPETRNLYSYHVQKEFLESLASSVNELCSTASPKDIFSAAIPTPRNAARPRKDWPGCSDSKRNDGRCATSPNSAAKHGSSLTSQTP
jgi:ferrochelatase